MNLQFPHFCCKNHISISHNIRSKKKTSKRNMISENRTNLLIDVTDKE